MNQFFLLVLKLHQKLKIQRARKRNLRAPTALPPVVGNYLQKMFMTWPGKTKNSLLNYKQKFKEE